VSGWDKFAKYIGVQGILALGLTGAAVATMFLHVDFPKEAWGLLGVAWGFFFAKNGGNYISAARGR
jgi:hypothetical protein